MWRLAMPALSKTPARRSNSAFLPPNASRARAFASDWVMTCGGTAVASDRRLQLCMRLLGSAMWPRVNRSLLG